ncbi:MAG: hypothetical protein LQ350_001603 [Teloschistes chrysophthalmus]|nr:MAG: hypothetical protein LQ350_001603 [Niorma chrysophthalma]
MRLLALPFYHDLLLVFFLLFCLALETQSLPPALDPAQALTTSHVPVLVTTQKRTPINRGPYHRILANGWRITFTLLSLIDPLPLARENLRTFYTDILHQNYLARRAGRTSLGPSVVYNFGRFRLRFFVERGFFADDDGGGGIDPEIVIAFASKVFEMTVPMTFSCCVRPPGGRSAGIFIELFLDGRQ